MTPKEGCYKQTIILNLTLSNTNRGRGDVRYLACPVKMESVLVVELVVHQSIFTPSV